MKCLRSGYCCIQSEVTIVDNPALGVVDGNVIQKRTGEVCKHLQGEAPGEYSCAVHSYPWYKNSPCDRHTQIGAPGANCRVGEYIVGGYKLIRGGEHGNK